MVGGLLLGRATVKSDLIATNVGDVRRYGLTEIRFGLGVAINVSPICP